MRLEASILPLTLPRRWEALERQAHSANVDLTRIVQRIDSAASRIETLLRQVQNGGLGRFELFLGHSGSGKTTFFRTLTTFFEGTSVLPIPSDLPLQEVAGYIRSYKHTTDERQVWVLYDRDNPQEEKSEARYFFETLRVLFREKCGSVVIIWPITDPGKALMFSEQAWDIGRDSIVDLTTKGSYTFEGVPRSAYIAIAATTARNLAGQTIESFGLSGEVLAPLARESATISEFFGRIEAKSAEINGYYRDLLKDKVTPSVWVLVAGDVSKDLSLTVATLTQGTDKRIDIDRFLKYLDTPDLDAAYLREWKQRRGSAAFLLKLLDVRLFELPPNVSLSAIRAYGESSITKPLKLKSVSNSAAVDKMKKAAFFKALVGEETGRSAYLRDTSAESAAEYRRMQDASRQNDKKLNHAIADCLRVALEGRSVTVDAEVMAPDSRLKPDIRVVFTDEQRVFCLEPTWRSTGTALEGEIDQRQSTLTVGHIQKYVLEKAMEYVKDLGL